MTISCSFHPEQAAHFHCHLCNVYFCKICITLRGADKYGVEEKRYLCTACGRTANSLGLSNILPPFWKKMGAIFAYPFQPAPLLFTTALAALGGWIPANWIVQLLVWIVMMKYAYAVLINTAGGSLRAPAVTWGLINDDVVQVFKQFVVYGLVGAAGGFLFVNAGPAAGWSFVVLITLFMPAIIMLLVATNSIIHAINPMLFIPIVFKIGFPYLLMYFFLFLLSSGPLYLFSSIPFEIAPPLRKFFSLFCGQMYAIISYHLMGYVLLQYHEKIGYTVAYDDYIEHGVSRPEEKNVSAKQRMLNTLDVLIKAGQFQKAMGLLREEIAMKPSDVNLSEKYYRLLKLTGERKRAGKYAAIHFGLLMKNHKKEQALHLLAEMIDNQMTPPAGRAVLQVADWYRQRGEFNKSLNCYAYFVKHNKGHGDVPEAYFKAAKILHENGGDSLKAKKILRTIVQSFPKHHLVPQIVKYFRSMG